MAGDRPSFWEKIKDDPATDALKDSLKSFATAQAGNVAGHATDKISGKEGSGDGVGGAVQGVADAASQGKGKFGTLFGGVKGAVKGLFGKKGKGGKSNKRPTNIIEDIWIGAPVEVVYDKWLKFEDWAGFTKGVEKVNEENAKDKKTPDQDSKPEDADKSSPPPEDEDEQVLNWTARIFWSRRSWKSHTTDAQENRHIRWNSEGPKGVIEGVVTFTPLGENLTLVLVVIEYRGKGLMEWLGNRWRTVGRRIRLDLKHFRRFCMTSAVDEHLMDQDEEEPDDEQDEQPDEPETDDTEQPDEDEPDEGQQEDEEPDEPEKQPERPRRRDREKVGAR